ncbi:MAG: hemerythrin domain-containing protein [Bacteriovoracia bacterium]
MRNDSSDIIKLLLVDHELLRQNMAALKAAESVEEKRKIYAVLLPLLECHTFAEEETLITRALTEEKLRPFAMEGLEEHDVTEFEAMKLKQAATDDQWVTRTKVLCELLEHHLKEEEEDFFPMAEKVLSREELVELGDRYWEAREKLKLAPIIQLPIRTSALEESRGVLAGVN